jgi:vacuolar-type H+-ATPase subunit F/Vma7
MTHDVRVLCRPDEAAGFALSGLVPLEARTPVEGSLLMEELMTQPAVGVVLVEEGVYGGFPDDLRRRLARRPLPMVVPFPGPLWTERAAGPEAYIVELLRQVIGYRVRLR